MKVLAWSLDTKFSAYMRSTLERVHGRLVYFLPAIVFALGGVVRIAMRQANAAAETARITGEAASFGLGRVLMPLLGGLAGFAVGLALTFLVGGIYGWLEGFDHSRFTRWIRFASARARLFDHRLWCFGIGIGALLLTLTLFYVLPNQFQPLTDSDSSRANIEMVPGTTIEQTGEVADRVAAILNEQPEVRLVMERSSEARANLFIMLKDDRQTTSTEFERRMAKQFQEIPDARVTFSSQGGGGGTGRDISVMLSGSNPEVLNQTAQTLIEQMKGVKGVLAPRIAADLQRPELVIVPRLDLAAQLGVTTSALSQAIRIATIGEIDQSAAKFSLSDRQVPIRVVLDKEARRDIATIENLPVPTSAGGSVPLKRVASIRFGAGPTQIQRFNQSRRIFVGADLDEGVLKGPVMQQINQLPIMRNLPAGVSNSPVGDEKWQGELIQNFIIAVVAGILLVFGVLVLLYRRFVSPLVNMTSLLLAPLGGLVALAIIGQPISISVYIGLLMLLGIVAKNSILLIDFAIEEMERGEEKLAAIMEAGHKRAQPIVMTTMAMTAGMVPTALSLSGDSAWRAPMGTTVIGGLILSTLLTLLIVPAGFSLADGLEKRVGPWLRTAPADLPSGRRTAQDSAAGGLSRRMSGPRRKAAAQKRVHAEAAKASRHGRRCARAASALADGGDRRPRAQHADLRHRCCWWRWPGCSCSRASSPGCIRRGAMCCAFAEAAMVGGLADWFAVTALFRRPLGLPIPHTAIIPEKKDRIADTMAAFLQAQFPDPGGGRAAHAGDEPRARGGQLPHRAARRSAIAHPRGRGRAARRSPRIARSRAARQPGQGGAQAPARQARGVAAARPDARRGDRRQAPPAAARKPRCAGPGSRSRRTKTSCATMIHKRANALLRLTGLDERLANSVLDGLYKLIAECIVDPNHPLRQKVEEGLEQLARDLAAVIPRCAPRSSGSSAACSTTRRSAIGGRGCGSGCGAR